MIRRKDDDEGHPVFEAYEYNPVGKGFADQDEVDEGQLIPAPQILQAGQELSDPFEHLELAGFGPIQASWLPRRPLGGTYDDHWMEDVWPNWPADYEFGFHNAAPDEMKNALSLNAGVNVTLTNLHPEKPEWNISLPNPQLVALMSQNGDTITYGLNIDTVFFDIASDRLNDPRIFLMSRLIFDSSLTDGILLARVHSDDELSELQSPAKPDQIARLIPENPEEFSV